MRCSIRRVLLSACAGIFLSATLTNASAEVTEVRFARQFSLGYLQFYLMEHHQLVEKHAKAARLPDVKVTWATINSPAAMNDALLSGTIDIVSGGVPGLVTIWARTQGTSNPVKGVVTMSSMPALLNSREARIKTIADFKPDDKIAMPGVKSTLQAIILQMAAAKQWGPSEYARLDPLTVGMPPPDATIALLSNAADVGSVFSVPPFQNQQLETPGIHTVLNSFDVFGGPHTFACVWTATQFREKNPKVFAAVIAAFREATMMMNESVKEASQLWIDRAKSKLPLDKVMAIAADPQVKWTMVPMNSMKFAEFMHCVGTIKVKPASWKDMFFPEIHDMPGS